MLLTYSQRQNEIIFYLISINLLIFIQLCNTNEISYTHTYTPTLFFTIGQTLSKKVQIFMKISRTK